MSDDSEKHQSVYYTYMGGWGLNIGLHMVTITVIFKSDFGRVPEMYQDTMTASNHILSNLTHTATEPKPFRLRSVGHTYTDCENSYCSTFHRRTFKFNSLLYSFL